MIAPKFVVFSFESFAFAVWPYSRFRYYIFLVFVVTRDSFLPMVTQFCLLTFIDVIFFFFACFFSRFAALLVRSLHFFVFLPPAPRLIFFGLLYFCQLLLGTMAAFLSQPSARNGRTLFDLLGRGWCCAPKPCTRCWSELQFLGSQSALLRLGEGNPQYSWMGRSIRGNLYEGCSWLGRCVRYRQGFRQRTIPRRCWHLRFLVRVQRQYVLLDPQAC